jgi:hypothetical protein
LKQISPEINHSIFSSYNLHQFWSLPGLPIVMGEGVGASVLLEIDHSSPSRAEVWITFGMPHYVVVRHGQNFLVMPSWFFLDKWRGKGRAEEYNFF